MALGEEVAMAVVAAMEVGMVHQEEADSEEGFGAVAVEGMLLIEQATLTMRCSHDSSKKSTFKDPQPERRVGL